MGTVSYTHLDVYKRQAKYTAVSVRECALDVAAMAETSTKVFVYEAMGRHAGWLAAAAGLAGTGKDDAPHPVSYTHLDVYKRQAPRSAPHTLAQFEPVSYTHLDVYKRQLQKYFDCPLCGRGTPVCACLLYTSRCV